MLIPADDGSSEEPANSGSASKVGGTSEGGGDDVKPADDEITKPISFSFGNPRVEASQATRGVMHFYRDTASEPGSLEKLPDGRSERLCVLAVPNHMTGSDFCQFTGAFFENIKEMHFVRNDGQTDRYSVLMTFDSQQLADDFYHHYNLKPFSSLEAELCHVLFMADVVFTETAEQASTPTSWLTELPTCPVCLEGLDQKISGIVTTVCNHSFHSSCISKWTDSSCPVCRYGQQHAEKSTCFICGTSENLWICVVCGFVGCGRYKEGHAVNHWKERQHSYSLDLETQRVWDYVGDGYVHQLIQSKIDGKLVELPAPCRDGSDDCCNSGPDNQRMESALYNSEVEAAVAAKYDYILKTQLDSQRQYYEGKIVAMEEEKALAIQKAVDESMSLKMRKLQVRLENMEKETRDLREGDSIMKTFGEPVNRIDPFSQEEVQSLGEDKLVLSNGDLTVAVNGELFLTFVKSEIESGRSLKDMVLQFSDAPSLPLDSVDLSSQVWLACHILKENYASELMRVINNIQSMTSSYKRRLQSLDPKLIALLQIFVHDLHSYGRDGDARKRLEAHLETQVFYLSQSHFTPDEVQTILAFPGKNGLPLKTVLASKFKQMNEVCTAHTLAPMILNHFDIRKDFKNSPDHTKAYKAFRKAWRRT